MNDVTAMKNIMEWLGKNKDLVLSDATDEVYKFLHDGVK